MTRMEPLTSKRVLELAATWKVKRGGLQAQISTADAGHPLDRDKALDAMRTLLAILEIAEGAP